MRVWMLCVCVYVGLNGVCVDGKWCIYRCMCVWMVNGVCVCGCHVCLGVSVNRVYVYICVCVCVCVCVVCICLCVCILLVLFLWRTLTNTISKKLCTYKI